MFAGFSQMHETNKSSTQMVITHFISNGTPVIILIALVSWYLSIYKK